MQTQGAFGFPVRLFFGRRLKFLFYRSECNCGGLFRLIGARRQRRRRHGDGRRRGGEGVLVEILQLQGFGLGQQQRRPSGRSGDRPQFAQDEAKSDEKEAGGKNDRSRNHQCPAAFIANIAVTVPGDRQSQNEEKDADDYDRSICSHLRHCLSARELTTAAKTVTTHHNSKMVKFDSPFGPVLTWLRSCF